jgi:nitrogenase molybdenum-iron protein alpha/beta subunit
MKNWKNIMTASRIWMDDMDSSAEVEEVRREMIAVDDADILPVRQAFQGMRAFVWTSPTVGFYHSAAPSRFAERAWNTASTAS